MSAPSLYRRHRPRTFSDVVGQESITRTLRNAIERGAVHHAYLFVGSRGTGKTSMAKILAAALNCQNPNGVDPCGECVSCVSIADGTSLDVVEMDAASNNSVEDIRELRERVALAPISGRNKVYVLDEAHMLTPQAWNAFLKTLEEPPANTVFVLATTEAHKVLATVVDRCHRFDFKRPSAAEIAEVVGRVSASEGIDAPPEAIALIARSSSGSFRDALGTLEQLATYAGEGASISLEDALDVLGVVDAELRFAAVDAITAADPAQAVTVAAQIAQSGRDLRLFIDDLEEHARSLLLVELAGEVPLELAVSPEQDERLASQASALGRRQAVALLDLIAQANAAIRDGGDARIRLELLLVKAASGDGASAEVLVGRIERLEAQLGGASRPGGAAEPPATKAKAAAKAPAKAPEEPKEKTEPAQAPPPEDAPSASTPVDPTPTATVASGALGGAAAALRVVPDPQPQSEPVAVTVPTGAPSLEEATALWPEVVAALRSDSPMVAALLEQARPVSVDDDTVKVAFPADAEFHRRKAEDARCREAITTAFAGITGTRPRLEFVLAEEGDEFIAVPQADALSDDEIVDILIRDFGGVEVSSEATEAQSDDPDQ